MEKNSSLRFLGSSWVAVETQKQTGVVLRVLAFRIHFEAPQPKWKCRYLAISSATDRMQHKVNF